MKEYGVVLLMLGCFMALFTINLIVGCSLGMQYFFLLIAAVLIICGLLIIKFDDKTEDKL